MVLIRYPKIYVFYLFIGRKAWISGAGDPRCRVFFLMGKTAPNHPNRHLQQSIIIIDSSTPGIEIIRPMQIFGYDDAPHGHMEIQFTNVRVHKGI